MFWLNLTYILKGDIRFHLNAHLNIYHWWKYYTETSFNMDSKKKKKKKNCAKLFKIAKQLIALLILRNIINNHRTSGSRKKYNMLYVLKF